LISLANLHNLSSEIHGTSSNLLLLWNTLFLDLIVFQLLLHGRIKMISQVFVDL